MGAIDSSCSPPRQHRELHAHLVEANGAPQTDGRSRSPGPFCTMQRDLQWLKRYVFVQCDVKCNRRSSAHNARAYCGVGHCRRCSRSGQSYSRRQSKHFDGADGDGDGGGNGRGSLGPFGASMGASPKVILTPQRSFAEFGPKPRGSPAVWRWCFVQAPNMREAEGPCVETHQAPSHPSSRRNHFPRVFVSLFDSHHVCIPIPRIRTTADTAPGAPISAPLRVHLPTAATVDSCAPRLSALPALASRLGFITTVASPTSTRRVSADKHLRKQRVPVLKDKSRP